MIALTITKLRKNIKMYFDAVTKDKEVIIIPRNETEDTAVVMISLSEYNSLVETNYLLSSEANRESLLKSIEQDKAGEGVPFDTEGL